MINKKNILAIIADILVFGLFVRGMFTILSVEPLIIEYQIMCSDLPANAYWNRDTLDPSRLENSQIESPSLWTPSLVGSFNETASDTECYFVCNFGYKRDGNSCIESSSGGISHDEVAGTITINDGTTSYTIMDKNLGATIAGTGSASYGYYFQWGNNYRFPNSGNVTTSTNQVDTIGKGPGNYYTNAIFITINADWSNAVADHADWSSNQNDNLRGGSGDVQANERSSTNYTERQGPCPDGFHVPSAGEWGRLVSIRRKATLGDFSYEKDDIYYHGNEGLPYLYDCQGDGSLCEVMGIRFMNDFLLPLAGHRNYDSASLTDDQGDYGNYWSSSPTTIYAHSLRFLPFSVSANYSSSRAYGFSVRCFKN